MTSPTPRRSPAKDWKCPACGHMFAPQGRKWHATTCKGAAAAEAPAAAPVVLPPADREQRALERRQLGLLD